MELRTEKTHPRVRKAKRKVVHAIAYVLIYIDDLEPIDFVDIMHFVTETLEIVFGV